MIRIAVLFVALWALVSCAVPTTPVDEPQLDLGDFTLGHNIVVAPELVKGPLSREASAETWISSVKASIEARLGRYEGERLVHLGVHISGYVLAQPGVPLLLSPKSALGITVTAWDDRAGGKFNEEAKEIFVIETLTGASVIGSGMTMTAEEQMANLSYKVAKEIEEWLFENRACMTETPTAAELSECWRDNKDKRLEEARKAKEVQ
ncbi:hypothetical protein SAMN05444000_11398 [Shimia gijangensis]|uniref:DUF4136 domain-containing protein n=1 Tax=Shimia gijangensis TaxID=1470563 RepID=A0A1M6MBN1_9RHOB|nr:hypothetical protein [Shimia gijangensis]SHJ80918.1 hypothetical protein SAMN05444000_11398 [Shimia gijangensis]